MKRTTKIRLFVFTVCLYILTVGNMQVDAAEKATAADVTVATSSNKKGIQGNEYRDGGYKDEDYLNLGINHVLLNLDMKDIINTDGAGKAYVYNGKTYYFNYSDNLIYYEWRVKELRKEGVTVSIVLLMGWSDNPQLQSLIYPGARSKGHYYYALNTEEAAAREQLEATFHYLAEVFGTGESFVQNWIIGNEVNMPEEYNYTGTTDAGINVSICAESYKLLYDALQDNNPYGKAYISLTHHWNNNNGGRGISSKCFLTLFADQIGARQWNLAFHAYEPNLQTHMWTEKSADWLSHEEDSPYVCGANLEVMTNYVKSQYGASHRIILSEQGFDANAGEDEQAAALAYTYYAAQRNDMIDAVIFVSWQDSLQSSHEGCSLGLLDSSGRKRSAYDVFKYMDSASADQYTDRYKELLNISDWTDNIIFESQSTDAQITGASIYIQEDDGEKVVCGLDVKLDQQADLEYRWLIYDIDADQWDIKQSWIRNNQWFTWYPERSGKYLIRGEVRVAGGNSTGDATTGYEKQKSGNQGGSGDGDNSETGGGDSGSVDSDDVHIIGKCQMPYWGEGGGYLIGVETNKNPDQKLQYELFIMDLTLYAEGKPAWVWSSGKIQVSEGNAFWAIWQPQYGYYLTYFRVYDEDGNLIDDECYGFANAY